MGGAKLVTMLLLLTWLVPVPIYVACADVSPGDVIGKTNWEKAQGLVPDEVLNWVKKGEFVLEIVELNYKPRDYLPPFAKRAMETNAGKYTLDESGWIIEVQTGQRPKHILGLPFPTIDPNDPRAGEKIVYNNTYVQYTAGDVRSTFHTPFIARSGYQRTQEAKFLNSGMDGNPKSAARPNPDGIVKYQIALVASPFDMAGTAVMTWRYADPNKEDNTFGYIPAIRRVRRMSPGNRSDALFGSDFAIDDAACYDGKVAAMEWKLLRKQDALVPFSAKDPTLIVQNERGEWDTTPNVHALIYGYEKEGWKGAPWAPVNWVWVKLPVYVIEMKAKDHYYNYGTQYLWVDAEAYIPGYKTINDRSGRYWKTILQAHACYGSADKKMALTYAGDMIAIDERSDHATVIKTVTPTNIWTYFANIDENDFSLAGFQKFCK